MALPLYTKPIKIRQKITMRGRPPYDLTLTVKTSQHTPDNWKVHSSTPYVVEDEDLSFTFDLIELDIFDVWYIELFIDAENVFGKTKWRSGPFGIFLGGYPPTLWYIRPKASPDNFIGIPPTIEVITPFDASFKGEAAKLESIDPKPSKGTYIGETAQLESIEAKKSE